MHVFVLHMMRRCGVRLKVLIIRELVLVPPTICSPVTSEDLNQAVYLRRMAKAEQISCNFIGQIDISTNKITKIGSRSTPL